MSKKNLRLIVLTGPPGCGKTTLVKNVCDILRKRNFTLNGFLTEEIRSGKERIGFDVVLMNGQRAPLARIKSGSCSKPTIGKYEVNVSSFEASVLPLFDSKVVCSSFESSSLGEASILVLDEIGKMEMLSEKFKVEVTKCLNHQDGVILATIPINSVRPIPLIEKIKAHASTCIITVDKNNRDLLINKIADLIISTRENLPSCVS